MLSDEMEALRALVDKLKKFDKRKFEDKVKFFENLPRPFWMDKL